MSSVMSRAEQQSFPLADVDLDAIRQFIFQMAMDWLFYAINATLMLVAGFLIGTSIIRKQYLKSQLALLVLLIVMLTFSTASLLLTLEFVLIQIPLLGYNPPASAITQVQSVLIASGFMDRTNFVISDGIVVWRAWIMFPHSILVKSVLSICFIGSFAGAYIDAVLGTVRVLHNVLDIGPKASLLVLAVPLLITNIVATSLIGYKAWLHHRDVRKQSSQSDGSIFKVEKVLLLLVESGVIYSSLWVTYLVLSLVLPKDGMANQIYASLMPFLSALYPILIILLVAVEKSRDEEKSAGSVFLSQSMKFASAQVTVSQAETSDISTPIESQVNNADHHGVEMVNRES